jgi:hypothetical protein
MDDPSQGTITPESPIARYYEIRTKRLDLNREAARLEVEEAKLKYEIFREWDNLKAPQGYKVVKSEDPEPFVEDWPAFLEWVRNSGAIDVLQRRLTPSAIMARLQDDVAVPGVTIVQKPKLTVEFNG